MNTTQRTAVWACVLTGLFSHAIAGAAERDIQFRSVDFRRGVIELFNYGTTDQLLTGWQFCSHSDDNGEFRYSGAAGLNGVTIEAATSLSIWVRNDGPGGADNINVASLGGLFATALDEDAYSVGLYWPNGGFISFASADDLADHMQWNIGGADNVQADARSSVAQAAGLWTDAHSWISTNRGTWGLLLKPDQAGNQLHGSTSYFAIEPGDLNFDRGIDASDAGALFADWGSTGVGDLNGDNLIDAADAGAMFANWTGDGLAAVPEPSIWGLLPLGMLALWSSRRFTK